jgi:chromosome transmission fidelity protein 4
LKLLRLIKTNNVSCLLASLCNIRTLTKIHSGAVNRKGKDKERKDLSRQTTLFGLPLKQSAEKGKSAKQGEETGPNADMSEVPPPSETATLVESQAAEAAPAEETQPVEEEVPIEWEASPPPASP